MVNTSQFDSKPDEVDDWTPYSHWCAGCWHWVVDCSHLVDPLPVEHHAVDDSCIASLAYHRATQCLEIRYRWHSIQQYRPVPLRIAREIWRARPISVALDKLTKENRHVRFDEVRSEGKVLMSLLRGWRLVPGAE